MVFAINFVSYQRLTRVDYAAETVSYRAHCRVHCRAIHLPWSTQVWYALELSFTAIGEIIISLQRLFVGHIDLALRPSKQLLAYLLIKNNLRLISILPLLSRHTWSPCPFNLRHFVLYGLLAYNSIIAHIGWSPSILLPLLLPNLFDSILCWFSLNVLFHNLFNVLFCLFVLSDIQEMLHGTVLALFVFALDVRLTDGEAQELGYGGGVVFFVLCWLFYNLMVTRWHLFIEL